MKKNQLAWLAAACVAVVALLAVAHSASVTSMRADPPDVLALARKILQRRDASKKDPLKDPKMQAPQWWHDKSFNPDGTPVKSSQTKCCPVPPCTKDCDDGEGEGEGDCDCDDADSAGSDECKDECGSSGEGEGEDSDDCGCEDSEESSGGDESSGDCGCDE